MAATVVLRLLQSEPVARKALKCVNLISHLRGSIVQLVDPRLHEWRGVFGITLRRMNRAQVLGAVGGVGVQCEEVAKLSNLGMDRRPALLKDSVNEGISGSLPVCDGMKPAGSAIYIRAHAKILISKKVQ